MSLVGWRDRTRLGSSNLKKDVYVLVIRDFIFFNSMMQLLKLSVCTWITLITIPKLWKLVVIISRLGELVVPLNSYWSDYNECLVVPHFKRATNGSIFR